VSSASFVVAGPLPLEALVKRVELISICATVAFADEGGRCPVIAGEGLTRTKCVLDSAVNRPVPLMRLGYYLLCRPRLACKRVLYNVTARAKRPQEGSIMSICKLRIQN